MEALDLLGADQILVIPKAGANYTDVKTVTAVQYALMKRGYDLGDTGPNRDGVDGVFGRKTRTAIEKMQKDAGLLVTGTINEDVIMTLKVTPGVLPPGVTPSQVAALNAEVALQAATKAEHAKTTGELQQAAQEAAKVANEAQPPLPPEVRKAAMDALEKSKKVTTPAQVEQVKQEVKKAAENVSAASVPWWKQPAWPGGWERWKVGAVGGGAVAGLSAIVAALFAGGKTAPGGRP